MFAKIFWAILVLLMLSVAGLQIGHHNKLQGGETAYARPPKTL